MSQKGRGALKTQRTETVYKNDNKEIKGDKHATLLDDILDSYVNFITDELRLNLREYNPSGGFVYKSGIGVLYQGKLYQANQNTGPGAFVPADWDEITGGTGGTETWRGEWVPNASPAYAVGEYVVYQNDLYECNNANNDAVFTPAN